MGEMVLQFLKNMYRTSPLRWIFYAIDIQFYFFNMLAVFELEMGFEMS